MRATKLEDCPKCKRLACVCEIIALHELGCPFRTAATCSIPIDCGHGRDCCPKCDKCTCKSVVAQQQEATIQAGPRRKSESSPRSED